MLLVNLMELITETGSERTLEISEVSRNEITPAGLPHPVINAVVFPSNAGSPSEAITFVAAN